MYNREQTRELIKVMQAYVDGEAIVMLRNGQWVEVDEIGWNWAMCNYQVKKDPKEIIDEVLYEMKVGGTINLERLTEAWEIIKTMV